MISVVIPTLNSAPELGRTLVALVPAAIEGLVREVVVADGGSSDFTCKIADEAGARVIHTERGRGHQLAEGARQAKGRWLLFLHSDTALQPGWEEEVFRHIQAIESTRTPDMAGAFRFALDDDGFMAACLRWGVSLRCRVFKMPYGDQGLLISRRLYEDAGGFRSLALMEDVDLIRRLGRKRISVFRSSAVTSARRYREEGYLHRMLRNVTCLSLYYLRVPPHVLARLYG